MLFWDPCLDILSYMALPIQWNLYNPTVMGSGKNVGLKRLLDYREHLNFGIQISSTSTHEGMHHDVPSGRVYTHSEI
jgi:hypothetical protein